MENKKGARPASAQIGRPATPAQRLNVSKDAVGKAFLAICSTCKHRYQVAAQFEGKRVRCGSCQSVFTAKRSPEIDTAAAADPPPPPASVDTAGEFEEANPDAQQDDPDASATVDSLEEEAPEGAEKEPIISQPEEPPEAAAEGATDFPAELVKSSKGRGTSNWNVITQQAFQKAKATAALMTNLVLLQTILIALGFLGLYLTIKNRPASSESPAVSPADLRQVLEQWKAQNIPASPPPAVSLADLRQVLEEWQEQNIPASPPPAGPLRAGPIPDSAAPARPVVIPVLFRLAAGCGRILRIWSNRWLAWTAPLRVRRHYVEAGDVFVLIFQSKDLAAVDYLAALEDLCRNPALGGFPGHRVGIFLAEGKGVEPLVSLPNPPKLPRTFYLDRPSRDATESPELAGPSLKEKMPKAPGNRRCLLIASGRCPAPPLTGPGWDDLASVDVILIATARQTDKPEPKELEKWLRFCTHKHGTFTCLRWTATGDRPDGAVVDQLRFYMRKLTSPLQQAR